MKTSFLFIFLCIQSNLLAQVENDMGINFQAIARNIDGSIVAEKNITIRLSIVDGSPEGKIAYQEIKSTKTNVVGAFNVVIGIKEQSYIVVIGNFNLINWQKMPKFLKVEIDPNGGIQFLNLGLQKINYVPYALVSNSVLWKNVIGLDSIVSKKINVADTALMLAGYQRKDTNSFLYLTPYGSAANLTNFPILNQNTTGKAASAFKADTAIVAQNITTTSNTTITSLPNLSILGTIVTGTWSGTSIANSKLENSQLTIGNTAIQLGKTTTTLSGLSSVTANDFIGNLNGNAASAVVAGNITATSNTTITSLPNLSSLGIITSGTWSGTAIANSKLENNQLTIGTTAIPLGNTTTTLSGLSTVTANDFIGNLNGNATTAVVAGNITATSNSTITSLPNLSSLGTITSGTWSGTVIDIAHGGTGVNQLQGILLGTNGSGLDSISTAAFGSWYDNTTQLAALANTAYPIVFSSLDFAQGVSIVDRSKITFAKSGKYNIQFSIQFDRSSGTSTEYASIWLRKNGVDVPATCTDITIQGGTLVAATVAAWNFFQNLNENDYLELIWSTTSTTIQIQYLPTRTNPIRPLIPSIILTAQQVY